MGIGIWIGMGMGNENGNENGIVPPVPGDGDDTTWGPPTTFSHEGVLLQKSSTSKNVFALDGPLYPSSKNITRRTATMTTWGSPT